MKSDCDDKVGSFGGFGNRNQVQNCSGNCVKNRPTFEGQEEVGSNLIWPLKAYFG